jgi:hypothetical protein
MRLPQRCRAFGKTVTFVILPLLGSVTNMGDQYKLPANNKLMPQLSSLHAVPFKLSVVPKGLAAACHRPALTAIA